MSDTTPLPLRSEFLFRMSLSTGAPQGVGKGRNGELRIVPVTGGTVEGPKLRGEVLPGTAADWLRVDPDGTAHMDVRLTVRSGKGTSSTSTTPASAPARPRCWRGSTAARRCSRGSTTSAPPCASRPARRSWTG